jgi:hypothetical protein
VADKKTKSKQTPPAKASPTDTAQTREDFIAKYGPTVALIYSVPELLQKFNDGLAQNITAQKWGQIYQASDWFNSTLAPRRDYELTKQADPGSFADQYNQLLEQMQTIAKQQGIDISSLGASITPDKVGKIDLSNPVAYFLSQHFNRAADPTILSQYVARIGSIARSTAGTTGGSLAATANDLKAYAASMGVASQFLTPTWRGASVQPGADYFTGAAQAILDGDTTAEAEKNLYKQQAMNIYKPFAAQIDKGFSVAQLANPYTSAAANLLEISPESINLGAATGLGYDITKALQGDGTNPMNLDQFTSQIKQRPEWLNTTNARNSLMDTATQLLRNFGMVVGG